MRRLIFTVLLLCAAGLWAQTGWDTRTRPLYITGSVDGRSLALDDSLLVNDGARFVGVVVFSDGTSATPAITNSGDLNTGIYFSGADAIDITAGGARGLTVMKAATLDCVRVAAPVFSAAHTAVVYGRLGVGIYPSSYPVHVYQNSTGYMTTFENPNNSAPRGLFINFTGAAPDNNTQAFLWCQDNAANRAIIYSDGDLQNADNSYGAISDSTLKEDITDAPDPADALRAVRVTEYRMRGDFLERPKQRGVLAQELRQIMPTLVDTAWWDSTYVDGRGEKQSVLVPKLKVNYMGFVMPLVQGYQKHDTRIDSLEAAVSDDSFGGVPIGQVVAGLAAAVAGLAAWVTTLKKQINSLEARIAKLEGVAPSAPNPEA